MPLFKSLKKKPLLQIFKDFLWPSMGFKRLFRYLFLRVLHLQSSPVSIATGLAIGVAISFTPFLGMHIIIALGLSWILRANKISTFLGTLVGTPWTLPFMLFLSYKTGFIVLHFFHKFFPNIIFSSNLLPSPSFNFKYIYTHPAAFFLPTLFGSLLLGLCVGLSIFFSAFIFLKFYRKQRGNLK
jgi:hypothetical protein